jgi:hypothetical protein
MENSNNENIKGWAIDADPENDPTYPIKHRTNEEHEGYDWNRPPQQPVNIEVLHSIERPNVTAVFGTSVPPSGLSGVIRRFAFKYGEGSYAHWLPLLLADRVNVVEGIFQDLKSGIIPNIFAERGIKAEWKYNKPSVIKKAAIGIALTAGAILYFKRRSK